MATLCEVKHTQAVPYMFLQYDFIRVTDYCVERASLRVVATCSKSIRWFCNRDAAVMHAWENGEVGHKDPPSSKTEVSEISQEQ
jgi:hypothetical protein